MTERMSGEVFNVRFEVDPEEYSYDDILALIYQAKRAREAEDKLEKEAIEARGNYGKAFDLVNKLEAENIGELIKRLCDKNIISTIMSIGKNESFKIRWYPAGCFMDWGSTDYAEGNDFETHAPTLKEVLEKACTKSDEFYATGKFKWDG